MATTKQKVKTATKEKASSGAAAKNRSDVVREAILKARDQIDDGYIDLARLLSEAYHQELATAKWGFNSFEEYCLDELEIEYRKTRYFIEIWDKVKSLNLPIERVKKMGWTKMKDLAAVITKENYEEWFDKAEKMTTREVTESVKTARSSGEIAPEVAKTTVITVKMGESEAQVIMAAIAEAKKMAQNDNLSLALEMICTDWLEQQEAVPERVPLENHIAYLERIYGVKLAPVSAKKAASGKKEETQEKTKEILEKVETKTKDAKKKGKSAPAVTDDVPEGGVDLNDLLSL